MSSLRRRIHDNRDDSNDSTPADSRESSPGPDVTISKKQLQKLQQNQRAPKPPRRRSAWVFGLGGLFGIVLAAALASKNDYVDLSLSSFKDVNLDTLLDVLPAGLVKDAQMLQVSPVPQRLILVVDTPD